MSTQDQTQLNLTGAEAPQAPANGEDLAVGQMLFGALMMAGVGVWVFFQLSKLETGDANVVRVWAPVAAAYNLVGFWPAVCILPTLAAYMGFLAAKRALESASPRELAA